MDMKINKNHLLFLVLTCLIILSSCSDSLSDTTDERLRYWISTLASDDFEGSAPGTEGGKLTKNFISKTFQDLNLEPLNGNYLLEVPASEITETVRPVIFISICKAVIPFSVPATLKSMSPRKSSIP